MQDPSFDKVRNLSTQFFRELPEQLQNELYESLNRGVDLLDSEPLMVTYLFSYGQMHQAKLNYSFGKMPKGILQDEINIIDYGCGQALGTMCYADFLRENGYSQKVKQITLIEPSEMVLKRAALHASVFFPNAEIKTINKTFDDLTSSDIVCSEETPTLHILSNVLDMQNFDLEQFAKLINESLKGYNQFVCVGPYFKDPKKDERLKYFTVLLPHEVDCDDYNGYDYYEVKDKFEFIPSKEWTCALCLAKYDEQSTFMMDYFEQWGEELDSYSGVVYVKGDRLLKQKIIDDSYSIPSGIRVICDGAFSNCDSLKRIEFPDSIRSIGRGAFSNCCSLQEITISDSIILKGNPFDGCYNIKEIKSPSSRFIIIDNCIIDSFNNELISYIGKGTNLVVLNYIKKIGSRAFSRCETLRQIALPESLTTIGESAFNNCRNLQQINLPDSIIKIGDGVFKGCESLRKITLPKSLKTIGNDAFFDCKLLNEINVSNSLQSIGDFAFYGCASMRQINLPNSISSIGEYAFWDCKFLKEINLPNSLKVIGDCAFYGCASMRQINLPNSICSIGSFAFWGCVFLNEITLPDSVKISRGAVFLNCRSLQKVTIPDNIILEGNPFIGCYNIKEIISPSSRFVIINNCIIDSFNNELISYIGKDTNLVVLHSISRIGNSAFSECETLQQITLPKSLTIIGENAFSFCKKLQQIKIPKTVTNIGSQAFECCYSLHKIIISKRSAIKFQNIFKKDFWDKLYQEDGSQITTFFPPPLHTDATSLDHGFLDDIFPLPDHPTDDAPSDDELPF